MPVLNKVFEYFYRLTLGGNKESSKRFIALYSTLLLTYAVFTYTSKENVIAVIGELSLLILSLLGIAAYENVKGVNHKLPTDEN